MFPVSYNILLPSTQSEANEPRQKTRILQHCAENCRLESAGLWSDGPRHVLRAEAARKRSKHRPQREGFRRKFG